MKDLIACDAATIEALPTLVAGLRSMEVDSATTQKLTGPDWITSISLNAD